MVLWVVRVVREELVQLVKQRLLSGWVVAAGTKECIDHASEEFRARVEYVKADYIAAGFMEKTEPLRRRIEQDLKLDPEGFKRLVMMTIYTPPITAEGECSVDVLVLKRWLEKNIELVVKLIAEFIESLAFEGDPEKSAELITKLIEFGEHPEEPFTR
jgi:hypothetical protein